MSPSGLSARDGTGLNLARKQAGGSDIIIRIFTEMSLLEHSGSGSVSGSCCQRMRLSGHITWVRIY